MANNATRDAENLIDILYGMVDNAKSAPLSGGDKCILARDEVLDLLEELRAALPAELERAIETIARFDILNEHGIIVAESPADKLLPEPAAPYRRGREYRYGQIKFTVYRREGEDSV